MKRYIIVLIISTVSAFLTGMWVGKRQTFSGNMRNEKFENQYKKETEIRAGKINGRYLMKDTNCAGFEFLSDSEVVWRNESSCFDTDTLAIFWTDENAFLTKTKNRKKANFKCPPLVSYFQVEKLDEKNLTLTDVWTGWGGFETDTLHFIK